MIINREELLLIVSFVISAARDLRDLLQHLLVQLSMNSKSINMQSGALRTANTDRVNTHSPIGRDLGGVQRVGRLVVLAIGQ